MDKKFSNKLKKVFVTICNCGKWTKPFDQLSKEVQDYFQKTIIFSKDELPIVAMFKSNDNWLLITTQKVAWKSSEIISSLSKYEITNARLDLNANKKRGINWNQGCSILSIINKENKKFDIEVEPGEALYGLINVIRELSKGALGGTRGTRDDHKYINNS